MDLSTQNLKLKKHLQNRPLTGIVCVCVCVCVCPCLFGCIFHLAGEEARIRKEGALEKECLTRYKRRREVDSNKQCTDPPT